MSEENKGAGLPKLELIVIAVFLLSFVIWSVSKCSRTRSELRQEDMLAQETVQENRTDSLARVKAIQDSLEQIRREQAARRKRNAYTPLFVTIDDLNVRNAPDLDGEVIVQLPLYEEVEFLNEWTDFTTEVNLGKEVTNEPWIKVRTTKGQEGWVYGAGVHYYKMRHPGAY